MSIEIKLIDLELKLNQLMLDPGNYRIDYKSDMTAHDDDDVFALQSETQKRLEKERLGELRNSILQNGFLEVDRIVVRKLEIERKIPLYLIVEGNRRAAAFKGLIEDHYDGLINLPVSLIEKANSIGVICVEGTKEEISEYSATLMGIRHVSGPKKWAGFQSARLINDLYEKEKSLTEIGALLGISAIDAGRRMRGYKAFIQMREDEDFGEISETKHYALLLEFLAPSKAGKMWLNWNDETYKFEDADNLKRLYSAITTKSDGSQPEIKNPNDARRFLNALAIDEHKRELESGIVLSELSPINIESDSKEKILISFLSFIEPFGDNVSQKEREVLERILLHVKKILDMEEQ